MAENKRTSEELMRESEVQKELGNKHFKSGDIDQSIECYSKAIELYPKNPIFFCNRAMAYLKKGLPLEAHKDCDSAINLESDCVKALYRRGMARKQLFRYQLASDDFRHVLSLDIDNKEAKRELEIIERLIGSNAVLNVKPIDKKNEFRSNKPLIKVGITAKHDNAVNHIVIKLPEKVPQNYFQFECDWRQLNDKNCQHLRLKYLEMIGYQRIKSLLTTTLEPQMMSSLLETISQSQDTALICNLLMQMTRTPRFATHALFMSDRDKEILRSIFYKLRDSDCNQDIVLDIESEFYFI